MKDRYESPLSSRYASEFMLRLFSAQERIQTWRRLWVALARAEHNLGLPVTAEQVAELEAHISDIDFDMAAQREKEVRHDVMAHVYTYGKAAPSAAGIIHLGATSCYVTDNADLILYREGLRYLRGELIAVLANLAQFAETYKATPTLGYTHYQPAQLVTVGKRAALWMQDFLSDLEELDFVLGTLKFRGCRGTTGTEASFLELFEGDGAKVEELNRQATQLIWTMNASVDNAFADFDRQRGELQQYVTREREALVEQLRATGDELVRTTLDAVPGLVGKILLYLVLALAVLIGGPFALGFWLGGVRAKYRIKNEKLKMKN